jgi:hypothetical protein
MGMDEDLICLSHGLEAAILVLRFAAPDITDDLAVLIQDRYEPGAYRVDIG